LVSEESFVFIVSELSVVSVVSVVSFEFSSKGVFSLQEETAGSRKKMSAKAVVVLGQGICSLTEGHCWLVGCDLTLE
jgi:hypothetical protein